MGNCRVLFRKEREGEKERVSSNVSVENQGGEFVRGGFSDSLRCSRVQWYNVLVIGYARLERSVM